MACPTVLQYIDLSLRHLRDPVPVLCLPPRCGRGGTQEHHGEEERHEARGADGREEAHLVPQNRCPLKAGEKVSYTLAFRVF